MIGAEFLGMIMLIVYVGAVAVLFLFVVMMLNITEQITQRSSRKGLINNISLGSIIGVIIFLELLVVIGGWKYKGTFVPLSNINLNQHVSNTHALGNILYTEYIHLFQISGMILLVSMIGAITLTFSKRENVKRQSYFTQIQREKDSAVSLVDVESGKGVKIDD
jgi:NADH-quinone oxidoreductase subunit J